MSEQKVTQVQFRFQSNSMQVMFRYADGREEQASLAPRDVMTLGIDIYRLDLYCKSKTTFDFCTVEGKEEK